MPGPLVFIVTLFGVFEGFLFSLFTCIMFWTQIYAIFTDETVSGRITGAATVQSSRADRLKPSLVPRPPLTSSDPSQTCGAWGIISCSTR